MAKKRKDRRGAPTTIRMTQDAEQIVVGYARTTGISESTLISHLICAAYAAMMGAPNAGKATAAYLKECARRHQIETEANERIAAARKREREAAAKMRPAPQPEPSDLKPTT